MRAIAYDEHGSSSVLHLVDRPDPQPGPGEVLVRIAVSGVNPTDWKSRAGAGSGRLPKPQVPNQDGAGIVAALGDGVTAPGGGPGVGVGRRVAALRRYRTGACTPPFPPSGSVTGW